MHRHIWRTEICNIAPPQVLAGIQKPFERYEQKHDEQHSSEEIDTWGWPTGQTARIENNAAERTCTEPARLALHPPRHGLKSQVAVIPTAVNFENLFFLSWVHLLNNQIGSCSCLRSLSYTWSRKGR